MSSSVITINAVPLPPAVPTASSTIQPTCGTPSGTIVVSTQTGVEYSLDGTTYQSSNTFSGLAPNDYTLYVRNTADATCVTISSSPIINTVLLRFQRHQLRFSLLVLHHQEQSQFQLNQELNIVNGTVYQSSNSFAGLTGNYTLYVRKLADATCVTFRHCLQLSTF
jgi:hypothetical protein